MKYEIVRKKFGSISILSCLGTVNKAKRYLIACDCSARKVVYGSQLFNAGEFIYECNQCHGDKKTIQDNRNLARQYRKEYNAWKRMFIVANIPSNRRFNKRTIDKNWQNFGKFLTDVGSANNKQKLFCHNSEYNKDTTKWIECL